MFFIRLFFFLITLSSLIFSEEILYKYRVRIGQKEVKGKEVIQEKINKVSLSPEKTEEEKNKETKEIEKNLDPKTIDYEAENLKDLEYYLKLKEKLEDYNYHYTLFYASTLRHIGLIYVKEKQFEDAKDYFLTSDTVFQNTKFKNSRYHQRLYRDLAVLEYRQFDNPCEAADWMKKCLDTAISTENDRNKKEFLYLQNKCNISKNKGK
ncbi:MAG: tetratricopeptide repeat protein [Leptospiraceae bacterium]|nr:tetratricopeptide repeat protein [Leptospiraceae bacterium]MCP5499260.1 tetratricopeptide repeat protein [Leptospiraceae bacterium]